MAKYEDDQRLKDVESKKEEALSKIEETYGGMVAESEKFYQEQIDANKAWEEQQKQFQQQQMDFAIQQVEQQRDQAKKDFEKEQSAAYVDWQKQSNKYGVEAERQAEAGLMGSGYSETAQVAMYTAYQNRVAVAREAITAANLDFDNAIQAATLQGNVAMAQLAYDSYVQRLELAMQGFEYKNALLLEQMAKEEETKATYDSLWNQVYNTILAEQTARRYNPIVEDKDPILPDDPITVDTTSVIDELQNKISQNGAFGIIPSEFNTWADYGVTNASEMRALRERQIADYYIQAAKKQFPDGVIKDSEVWDTLVYMLGENTLKRSGLSYGG